MFKQSFKAIAILLFISLISFSAFSQKVSEPSPTAPEWSKPYRPFRIAGNLYYVGTADLACYLITTSKGNILINTGLANSETIIKTNIKTLGFKVADTKILLTTQAHFDHMGAMAAIKKLTGAKMMIDDQDAAVMEDGGRSDYALGGSESSYEPVKADRLLKDRDTITLGNMHIVMLHHPGHTKGSCSFIFNVRDERKTYKVLIANMPSIVTSEKLNNIPKYPNIAQDYAYSFKSLKTLSFDIWLSSHASQFGLHKKHKLGDQYNPAAFIDQKGYDNALEDLHQQFLKKVAEDQKR
jgi:metallo-beta-lactamase class B